MSDKDWYLTDPDTPMAIPPSQDPDDYKQIAYDKAHAEPPGEPDPVIDETKRYSMAGDVTMVVLIQGDVPLHVWEQGSEAITEWLRDYGEWEVMKVGDDLHIPWEPVRIVEEGDE